MIASRCVRCSAAHCVLPTDNLQRESTPHLLCRCPTYSSVWKTGREGKRERLRCSQAQRTPPPTPAAQQISCSAHSYAHDAQECQQRRWLGAASGGAISCVAVSARGPLPVLACTMLEPPRLAFTCISAAVDSTLTGH